MAKRSSGQLGSKKRILQYLLQRVGQVVTKSELQEASGGAAEWARRVRELRDEEGYRILSHLDHAGLKPGEYVLESTERGPVFRRDVSKQVRAFVLDRNGYTCQSCGLGPGDADPYAPERKVQLVIGHIIDKVKGGSDDASNLRALCTNCNSGLQNRGITRPELKQLMTQVRRATVEDQLHLLDWLQQKFKKGEKRKAIPK
jgi:5-methylcytosine-specific restriction endonuclease McrA